MSWQVLEGDCVEVMRGLDECSVDAVVCDPPYGLEFMGKEWDAPWKAEAGGFQREGGGNPYSAGRVRYGRGNNGESAAFQRWCEAWATEALRVLKPGGHLLAFGGTRTYHRLTCAIEDAGFEIRDCLCWLYGSGFPKSLDVSKAIDKRRDDVADVRVVCRWLRARIDAHTEHTVASLAAAFEFHPRMVEHWAARDTDSQPTLPTLEQWDELRALLGFDEEMDAGVLRLNLRKGEPGDAWADRPVTGAVEEWRDRTNYALTSRDGLRRDTPATPEAQQWNGWGTALKPAHEPIVLARKPLIGTVAANVLEHGTGALNVDGCRVEHDGRGVWGNHGQNPENHLADPGSDGTTMGTGWNAPGSTRHDASRWPANVLLDEEAARLLDEQTGELTSGKEQAGGHRRNGDKFRTAYGDFEGTEREPGALYGDTGGASRFFKTATRGPEDEWPPPHDPANTAAMSSSPPRRSAGSARSDAATSALPATQRSCPAPSTTATPSGSSESDVSDMPTTPSIGPVCSPASQPESTTPSSGHASDAAQSEQTDTTRTTRVRSTFAGSAAPAMSESTLSGAEAGAPAYEPPFDGERFRYTAKASRAERNAGLESFDEREAPTADYGGMKGVNLTRSDGGPNEVKPTRNVHPTVKPIDLMRWLCRLVTPKGGRVLDPFTGSGTTGCAAVLEGFDFLGLEREPEYAAIARARIGFWETHGERGLEIVRRRDAAEAEHKALAEAGQMNLLEAA